MEIKSVSNRISFGSFLNNEAPWYLQINPQDVNQCAIISDIFIGVFLCKIAVKDSAYVIRVEAFVNICTHSFHCDYFISLNLLADDFFCAAFYAFYLFY